MFTLTEEQLKKLQDWQEVCKFKMLSKQRLKMSPEDFELYTFGGTVPYLGAIGGGYTYSFTPNGLGTSIVVTNTYLEENLDLTDYGNW